jgi:hypothetical protein
MWKNSMRFGYMVARMFHERRALNTTILFGNHFSPLEWGSQLFCHIPNRREHDMEADNLGIANPKTLATDVESLLGLWAGREPEDP